MNREAPGSTLKLVSDTVVPPAVSDRPEPSCWSWPITYGDTSPGLKTLTLPPVIGETSEPLVSFAPPGTPASSLSDARASVNPLSSLMAVD